MSAHPVGCICVRCEDRRDRRISEIEAQLAAAKAENQRLRDALLRRQEDFDAMREAGERAQQIAREVIDERDRLRAALLAVEHKGENDGCPECGCGIHAPDCIVGLAIGGGK